MIDDNTWEQWQEDNIFTHKRIHRWMNTWELTIKDQKQYGLALLLRGISCLLMKQRIMITVDGEQIDPRIPLVFFSPSGTGKGMGVGFYMGIFKELDLKITTLAKPTPEKLIGSFNDNIHNENKKRGLKIGDEKYRSPIIHGYFELYDDIIFDEAEPFFSKTEYGEDVLRKCRMVLDTYGSPNNLLKSETLKNQTGYEYHSKANIMFSSYHIESISKQILHNGIFQRCLCLFFHSSIDGIDNLIGRKTATPETVEQNKKTLVTELKKVKKFVDNLEQNIIINNEAMDYLVKNLQDKVKQLFEYGEDIGKTMQTFMPRLKILIIKIATSLAVIKEKKIIGIVEMEEAVTFGMSIGFESLKREIFVYGILGKQQAQFYKDLKMNLGSSWRKKEEINQIMSVVWSVHRGITIQRLKELKGLFIVKGGDKNTQFYKLR